jgi:LuxR family maltose regulon positive regulatory protein
MAAPAAERLYDDPLNEGSAAMQRGAWREARAFFEQAVAERPTAEAYEGLGWASRWLEDMPAVFPAWEEAYRRYRDRQDLAGAGRMAIWLAFDYRAVRGDQAVANGWLERSRSLLDGLEPHTEHGWLNWHRGYLALTQRDVGFAKTMGAETASLGAKLGDCDIEMLGRSLEGYTLVLEGSVAEGMRRLDEAAVAATSGEMRNPSAMAIVCCLLVHGCERVRDYERAAQWCEVAAKVCERWANRHMFSYCRTQYVGVLVWHGRWREAQEELSALTRDLAAMGSKGYVAEALIRLGELRRRQGRFAEAEELLARAEAHPSALQAQAALALAKGDLAGAIDACKRLLRRIPETDRAERFPAYELLLRAALAASDLVSAAGALDELRAIADDVGTDAFRAGAGWAEGLLAFSEGAHERARMHFEDALDLFGRSGASWEAAQVRLDLAETLGALGREDAAAEQACAAHARLEELGAAPDVERARALMAKLQPRTVLSPESTANPAGLTGRELEVAQLIASGLSNQQIAQALVLSVRTVERHISTIYEKIGATGRAARAAATAYVLLNQSA